MDLTNMDKGRCEWLEGRMRRLREETEELRQVQSVLETYTAMTLQAFGCVDEVTGVEMDLREIGANLHRFQVVAVPTEGTGVRVFAREKSE